VDRKTGLSTCHESLHAGSRSQDEGEHAKRDTLYFNAFTEDLFHWNNDLDGDSDRTLAIKHAIGLRRSKCL